MDRYNITIVPARVDVEFFDQEYFTFEYDGEVISTVDLYYRKFNGEEQSLATNSCAMIRYPFMKIKDYKNVSPQVITRVETEAKPEVISEE